jgi:hypothetical protein
VVPDTLYIIPYRVRGDCLELVAVFHGGSDGLRSSEDRSTVKKDGQLQASDLCIDGGIKFRDSWLTKTKPRRPAF